MKKYKIIEVSVVTEDGKEFAWSLEYNHGTLSISENARKAGGYRNAQEWTEFHITWIEPHPTEIKHPVPPVEEVEVVLGISADDYLDDPLFMGIEHGVPKFRKPQDLIDFGLDGVWNDTGL